jgi:hypothetical protein
MSYRGVLAGVIGTAVLLLGILPVYALDGLIVGPGSTVTVNDATLDMNCLDIRIETQGTLNLDPGTIEDAGEIIVETNGTFNQGTGTILYCPDNPAASYLLWTK